MDSKKLSTKVNEKELLQLYIVSNQLDENISKRFGDKLLDKSFENSDSWDVIMTDDNVYGTDWYFVSSGTFLENGTKLKNTWLVNYYTSEVQELLDNNYIRLKATDSLGIKDNLIFCLDSSIMDGSSYATTEDIAKKLGSNCTLEGFDGSGDSGLKATSFDFDGIDDAILVDISSNFNGNNTIIDSIKNNGITFEFYGVMEPGNRRIIDGASGNLSSFLGLFYFFNSANRFSKTVRFGIAYNGKDIRWSAYGGKFTSELSEAENSSNQVFSMPNSIFDGKPHYFCFVLDPKTEIIDETGTSWVTTKYYLDGSLLKTAKYSFDSWNLFVSEGINSVDRLLLCSGYWGLTESWTKAQVYCFRFYANGLTDEEECLNYEKSIVFHKLIEKLSK